MASRLADELAEIHSVGTKVLIEVEIMETRGYDKLMASMMVPEKSKQLEDLAGVSIQRIFTKEQKVVDTNNISLKQLLELSLEKVNAGNL